MNNVKIEGCVFTEDALKTIRYFQTGFESDLNYPLNNQGLKELIDSFPVIRGYIADLFARSAVESDMKEFRDVMSKLKDIEWLLNKLKAPE